RLCMVAGANSVLFCMFLFERTVHTENYTLSLHDALPIFEDISKIRNRNDKSITFYTDKNKESQDFYWRYARGQEKVDTKREYTLDRKSTRLNSSHVKISYAVFCLKKKKIKPSDRQRLLMQ